MSGQYNREDEMAHSTSALSRWTGASILYVAVLFSPGAIASPTLFGMATVPFGATPVVINPITGMETQLTPGFAFTGNAFDVVASANTVYFISALFPDLLNSLNATTGDIQTIPLNMPIADMTVNAVSGTLFGMATVPFGATPVVINPITGMETQLTPGFAFTGNAFDVVASANQCIS